MAIEKARAYVQLVTSNGVRVGDSGNGLSPLHGHVGESKLPDADRLDLPSTTLRDLFVPHTHSFATDPERVSESLVRATTGATTEVVENVLERNGSHVQPIASLSDSVSVSMLPLAVKPLTRRAATRLSNLPYMSRRVPKDDWAIKRGAAMRTARESLGKSQQEIAGLVGVTREAISQAETGITKDIDSKLIPKLAMALGMHPQQLSRAAWKAKDEAADLHVSTVARQIAYGFDHYPLAIQNDIRQAIARYEAAVKDWGKDVADAMFTPPGAMQPQAKRKRGRA